MFVKQQFLIKFGMQRRLKALAVHLSFSLLIFVIILFVMLNYWYPMPHFEINGGWQGVRILVVVDLVLGPLLTFLIFNGGKSKNALLFDLVVIFVLQILLLIYGVEKIYSQRPLAQVISHQGFIATPRKQDLVTQIGISPMRLIKNFNVNRVYPPMVYSVYENYFKLKSPFDNMFSTKVDESVKGLLSPERIVSRFRPLNSPESQAGIIHAAEKAMKRIESDPKKKVAIEAYKKQHGNEFYFFPLLGQYGDAILVLDKLTQEPIDYFSVDLFSE